MAKLVLAVLMMISWQAAVATTKTVTYTLSRQQEGSTLYIYLTHSGVHNAGIFKGTYDGQGFTISGIRVYTDDGEVGLFGYTKESTVQNVVLSDCQFSGRDQPGEYRAGNGRAEDPPQRTVVCPPRGSYLRCNG